MPLTRYQIRNEYSLADPELYREADKDDPEALLEGVAMAGLVGILRQLGDLAEFAAEIFHDLHEEVMATAARGHGLMVRVQQLETDFPSIEKAFLSQTSPSMFFYDPGVEWHPNLRMDQNLITQGDLPRFVMDSYEECRGPPRLFLLDKFDVAGAGACLKRYTDPSFFKVESSSSGLTKAEGHREKKTRKAKKKGSRWRNGETPEVLPASHAKLHQLFMEESVEDYIRDPSRRVKLKRRLNGFPFDLKMGKSYMEKFLKTSTPDHTVRDISVNSSPLRLPCNAFEESGIQTLEISTVNPGKELPWIKRSPWSSPDAEKTRRNYSMDELNEEVDYGILEVPNPNHASKADTVQEDEYDKGIVVNRERKIESSVDDYQSDDIASEVENYMDALANMDSEMETDSECRAKKGLPILNTENVVMNSDANVELQYLQAHFSENSTATDDENGSSRKGLSSFSYSDSLSNSAENAPSDGDVSASILPSTGSHEAESVSSEQAAEHMASNSVCTEESSFSLSDSINLPVNPGKISKEGESVGLESDEIYSVHNKLNTGYVDREENTACLGDNVPCTSSCSDGPSQTRYDFLPELLAENHFVHELDNENSHVLSHSSGEQISEHSSDNVVQAGYLEDERPEILVDNPLRSVTSELETWHPYNKPDMVSEANDVPPLSAQRETSSIHEVYSPQASDITKQQFPGISETDPHLELDSADVGFHNYEEENLDKATNAADNEEISESSCYTHIFGEDAADLELPSNLQDSPDSPLVPAVHLDDAPVETVHSEVLVDKAVVRAYIDCNGGEGKALSGSPKKLQEESNPVVQDLRANGVEITEPYCQEHFQESGSQEEADQTGVALSFLDPVMFSTVSSDKTNLEVLNNVPDPDIAAPCRSLQILDATTVALSSDLSNQQPELKSAQASSLLKDAENCQKVELQDDHFDVASCCEQDDVRTVSEPPENSFQSVYASIVPLSSDQHDQQSELKYVKQINVVEDAEDDVSSYDCNIAELRPAFEQKSDSQDNQYDLASRCGQDSESESSHEIIIVQNTGDAVSSCSHNIVELKVPLEQQVEQYDRWDAEHLNPDKARSDPVMELIQSPNQANASLSFCVEAHPPSEPSVLEILPQVDVSNKAKDVSFSAPPSFGLLPEGSQINLNEMPPLPPLPPMQWRLGKLQHASLTSKRDWGEHNRGSFLPPLMSTADDNTQLGHLAAVDEIARPSIPFMQLSASKGENSQHSENLAGDMMHSNTLSPQGTNGDLDITASVRSQSTNSCLLPPMVCGVGTEHGFGASDGETSQPNTNPVKFEGEHNRGSSPPLLMSTADGNIQLGHLAAADEIAPPSISFMQLSASKGENSQHTGENLTGNMMHSTTLSPQVMNGELDIPASGRSQSTNSYLLQPMVCGLRTEHGFGASDGETSQRNTNPLLPPTNIQDTALVNPRKCIPEEMDHPLHQLVPESSLKDDKLQGTSVVLEGKALNPLEMQVHQPHDVSLRPEEKLTWPLSLFAPHPPSEDGNSNGNRPTKLPRPRNPLIDAVVAHDKSKLRKVTEQGQSQVVEKIEERDSLLEQIRTKSFNLKPAALMRPSIQGPKTNLRVAAILEKANSIRQAFAGSDEDDDADSWSDS